MWVGGLLGVGSGGGGGAKGMLAPLSNYWGGGGGGACCPPFLSPMKHLNNKTMGTKHRQIQ